MIIERNMVIGNRIEVKMEVQLDLIDKAIMDIFTEHPSWHFKAHQIRTILEYKHIQINHVQLTRKLDFLVITTILSKNKGNKVYSYYLNNF